MMYLKGMYRECVNAVKYNIEHVETRVASNKIEASFYHVQFSSDKFQIDGGNH